MNNKLWKVLSNSSFEHFKDNKLFIMLRSGHNHNDFYQAGFVVAIQAIKANPSLCI